MCCMCAIAKPVQLFVVPQTSNERYLSLFIHFDACPCACTPLPHTLFLIKEEAVDLEKHLWFSHPYSTYGGQEATERRVPRPSAREG